MSSSWFAAIVAKMKPKKRRQIETDPIALKFNWVHAGPMTPMIVITPETFDRDRKRMDATIQNVCGIFVEFKTRVELHRELVVNRIERCIKADLLRRVDSIPRLIWWRK